MFTSIRLTWEPPMHLNGDILRYTVQYKVQSEPQVELNVHLNHSFVISDLVPDILVVFTVMAVNSAGQGKPLTLDNLRTPDRPRENIE